MQMNSPVSTRHCDNHLKINNQKQDNYISRNKQKQGASIPTRLENTIRTMFPLVLIWVRQQGAWKLHPYNFVIANCLITVILTKPDKFEAPNSYCHPCIYNNLLLLTTSLPHCHTASTKGFLHLFHSSLQQKKHVNTLIQVPPYSTFSSDHMHTNIFLSLSTFYPFFGYPVLNFLTPLYHRILLLTILFTSFHALLLFPT